jgi:hypothetical protein
LVDERCQNGYVWAIVVGQLSAIKIERGSNVAQAVRPEKVREQITKVFNSPLIYVAFFNVKNLSKFTPSLWFIVPAAQFPFSIKSYDPTL